MFCGPPAPAVLLAGVVVVLRCLAPEVPADPPALGVDFPGERPPPTDVEEDACT